VVVGLVVERHPFVVLGHGFPFRHHHLTMG
jgi:hypothetical protein